MHRMKCAVCGGFRDAEPVTEYRESALLDQRVLMEVDWQICKSCGDREFVESRILKSRNIGGERC